MAIAASHGHQWEADWRPCRVCCAELKPGDSYDRAIRLLNHDNRWKVRPVCDLRGSLSMLVFLYSMLHMPRSARHPRLTVKLAVK
jgi:hypothetical protein